MRLSYGIRAALFVLLLAGAFVYFRPDTRPELVTQSVAVASALPENYEPATLDTYGFSSALFTVETRTVERGDTYAGLLGTETWTALEASSADVLREVTLRAGGTWHVYSKNGTPHHVVYPLDVRRYVVLTLGEAPVARLLERPVQRAERAISGVVHNSLYATLDEANASNALAGELAAIFGAQIDFYRLQKGDQVSVVYEEERIDGEVVGAGHVLAARIVHAGQAHEAFRFEQDGVAGYYDAHGKNVENGFLKSPLKFSRITSGFTLRRFHPVQKRWKAHLGTDYAAPHGTPILAVGAGVVTAASRTRGNGNYVKIRHDRTYETQYLHMSRFAAGVRPGTRVEKGDVIGYVGSTGLATGPHVCFRFWKNGVQVDHRRELGPEMPPVAEKNRAAFDAALARLQVQLAPESVLDPLQQRVFPLAAFTGAAAKRAG